MVHIRGVGQAAATVDVRNIVFSIEKLNARLTEQELRQGEMTVEIAGRRNSCRWPRRAPARYKDGCLRWSGSRCSANLALLRQWIELNRDVIVRFWDGERSSLTKTPSLRSIRYEAAQIRGNDTFDARP